MPEAGRGHAGDHHAVDRHGREGHGHVERADTTIHLAEQAVDCRRPAIQRLFDQPESDRLVGKHTGWRGHEGTQPRVGRDEIEEQTAVVATVTLGMSAVAVVEQLYTQQIEARLDTGAGGKGGCRATRPCRC